MGFIQGKEASQGSGSSLSLTLNSTIASGHRLLVFVYVYGAGITLDHVADSLGNQGAVAGKYDQVVVQPDPFNGHFYLMSAPVSTGGTVTITATASGTASFMSMWVGERDDMNSATGSGAWDVTASHNGTFATGMTTGTTAATGAAGEVAVAAMGWTDVAAVDRVTTPAGWTERFNASGVSGTIPLVVNDQLPSSGATVADPFTGNQNDSGNGYAAIVAVFKPAGGGGPQTLSPSPTAMSLATAAMSWAASSTAIVPATTLGAVRGATGHSAQGRLFFARNTGRWWFLTYVGRADSGTFSSGSASQGTDSSKSWAPGQWLGYACIVTGGTGAGQSFTIGSNTATSLPVVDNGATGSWLHTALDATSTYELVENRVRAYVSSSSDLATATWSEATGSPSPTDGDGHSLGEGLNLAGGSNNPGGYGEYPTDGRLLAMAYGNVSGIDVVHLLMQQDSHYIHVTERARIVGPTTIAWDAKLAATGNLWNDTAPGIEDAPEFPQALSITYHPGTGLWWWLNEQNFIGISGYASGVADNGSANQDPQWAGNNGALKPTGFDSTLTSTGAPWNSAVVPLGSGFVLAVYCNGTEASSTPSAGNTRQTGLRFAESASPAQWPTASGAGAAVPGLSSSTNSPNDWGICKVSDTDIHVVCRDGPTAFRHVRYGGHGSSWTTGATMPTTGLTGHLAASGVALVSDGTNVWAFVIDTDANSSIRWAKWNGTSWSGFWSTLVTGAEPKTGITAAINADGTQVGVAWSTATGAPYAVNYAAFNPSAAASQILAPSPAGPVLATSVPSWSSPAILGPSSAAAVLAAQVVSWTVGGVGGMAMSESINGWLMQLTGFATESAVQTYAQWAGLTVGGDDSLYRLVNRKLVANGKAAQVRESLEATLAAGGAVGTSVEQMLAKTGLTGWS